MSTPVPTSNDMLHQLPRLCRDHAVDVLTGMSQISMDITAHPGYELVEETDTLNVSGATPSPAVHVGPDAAAAAMGAI